jgi:Zn ribbon nucleic-acid-binding protein
MDMKIKVSLPTDEKGFTGRECPRCTRYFKVKFGTGLHATVCHCPYCGYAGNHKEFDTKDQIEYAKSVAVKKAFESIIEPELRKLEESFKELERATRGGLIQIKVKTQGYPRALPLSHYQEKKVETHVACDNCGLEFAVYGVFAGCPDCGKLNALIVFRKSIEVARKRIQLLDSTKDADLQNAILEDALTSGVSAFDALGKALQSHYPEIFPKKPKNLFQNLDALSRALAKSVRKSLPDLIGEEDFSVLSNMFQVRHIFEHNLGVVDDDFVRKVPDLAYLRGRKYPLERDAIDKFLDVLLDAGNKILKISEP